jgi:peptidoglycan-associated lipoprotein
MSPSRLFLLAAAVAMAASGGCASRRAAGARPDAASAGGVAPGQMGGLPGGAPPAAGIGTPGFPATPAERASLVREFAQTAGERVFFAFDSYALDASARATLDAQAAWLRGRPGVRVLLAGHADERGTRDYNLALGSRRAQAARDHLVSRGVEAARIETTSYGKERPVDPRSNEEGWAVNRNAHTVLIDLVEGF